MNSQVWAGGVRAAHMNSQVWAGGARAAHMNSQVWAGGVRAAHMAFKQALLAWPCGTLVMMHGAACA